MNIHCTYKDLLPVEELSTEMTKSLKIRTRQSVVEETKRLLQHGFLTPVFVWKNGEINEVIDGVGRVKAVEDINYALYGLGENGELVPKQGERVTGIPVVYIEAASFEEAKKKVLLANSMFGKIDMVTLDQYSKATGEDAEFIKCHQSFFEINEYSAHEVADPPLEIDWLTSTYNPSIDDIEVGDRDIEKAESKIREIAKKERKELINVQCGNCGHSFTIGK